jgi:hypothetical protein
LAVAGNQLPELTVALLKLHGPRPAPGCFLEESQRGAGESSGASFRNHPDGCHQSGDRPLGLAQDGSFGARRDAQRAAEQEARGHDVDPRVRPSRPRGVGPEAGPKGVVAQLSPSFRRDVDIAGVEVAVADPGVLKDLESGEQVEADCYDL